MSTTSAQLQTVPFASQIKLGQKSAVTQCPQGPLRFVHFSFPLELKKKNVNEFTSIVFISMLEATQTVWKPEQKKWLQWFSLWTNLELKFFIECNYTLSVPSV